MPQNYTLTVMLTLYYFFGSYRIQTFPKPIPQIPRLEWERYFVMPPPQPLPGTTSARVAWWDAKHADFSALALIAAFFVRHLRSAAHVERVFSLIGHIQRPDRRYMSSDILRYLAIMYGSKDEDFRNEDNVQ